MWEIIKKIFKVILGIATVIVVIFISAIGGYFLRFGLNFVCFVLDLFDILSGFVAWVANHQTAVWVICAVLVPPLWFLSLFEGSGDDEERSFSSSSGEEEEGLIGKMKRVAEEENQKITFVDCSGAYRQWGDSFIDYSGNWCQWGDTFCDAAGNYVRWGGTYKDSSGAYRNFGDDFVDYAGNWVHIN